MKKTKFLLDLSLKLILVIGLCGCNGKGNPAEIIDNLYTDVQDTNTGETVKCLSCIPDFPAEYVETVNDSLSFNAVIIVPEGVEENTRYEITGTIQNYNNVQVEKLFMRDVEIVQKETVDVAGEGGKIIDHTETIEGENGERLYMSNGHIVFKTSKWDQMSGAFHLSKKEVDYNANIFDTGLEFKFSSAEMAYKDICEKLENIGFSSDLEYKVYSLEHELLNKEWQNYDYKSGEAEYSNNEEWNETDDTYYFSINQLAGALPVYRIWNYGSGQEGESDTAPVQVAYNSNGILYFELYQLYDFEYAQKQWELAPMEEIINTVKKRYDLAVTGDKVEFTSFNLAYIANFTDSKTIILTPVWLCNNTITTTDGNIFYNQVIVNASTAEEMIYKFN